MRTFTHILAAVAGAALAAACSGTPTGPTAVPAPAASDTAAAIAVKPADPGAAADTRAPRNDRQKVTVNIYSDDDRLGGNMHLVGLPVTITTYPSGRTFDLATGKQGAVSFWTDRQDTSMRVVTEEWRTYCGIDVTLALPLHPPRGGWLLVHNECGR